jgi:outer membrane protein
MKRLYSFTLFMALASAVVAAGQAPAAPAAQKPAAAAPAGPSKVAVIMFQAAVGQTNEFQRDFADLQKKYDPRRVALKNLSDEVDALTKQLQTPNSQMTDAERVSKTRDLDDKKKKLDRDSQDAQSDFQNDVQQILSGVADKVGAVLNDYAEKHGYTIVLDAGDQQNGTVLYAVESTNITKEIIDAYNLKSGVPAPPPQGAAGQAPLDAPAPQPAPAH